MLPEASLSNFMYQMRYMNIFQLFLLQFSQVKLLIHQINNRLQR